jgi:hypothetical protein
MSEAIHDWDGWLNRLVEEDTARKNQINQRIAKEICAIKAG